ncbi:MAG: hypothetical protein IJC74_05675 [Clostridia bacterium]|nr:hypothetical protein [Clostridia bacterium]
MTVNQVSVFLENTKGRICSVAEALKANNINMIGISIADTADFGILRIVVAEPEKAYDVLKKNGFMVELTEVLAISVDDQPGGLADAFKIFNDNEIEIEYLYAVKRAADGKAVLVVKTPDVDHAAALANTKGVKLLTKEEFYSL